MAIGQLFLIEIINEMSGQSLSYNELLYNDEKLKFAIGRENIGENTFTESDWMYSTRIEFILKDGAELYF